MDPFVNSPFPLSVGTPFNILHDDEPVLTPQPAQVSHAQTSSLNQSSQLQAQNVNQASENPQTPQKNIFGNAMAPQSLIQPQTPTMMSPAISGSLMAPGSAAPLYSPAPMTPQSTDPGIVPQLQNIVSTVNLGCKLDLKKIALHARNAEYNPKRFAAVIMRIREPRTTALIFSSGKMVCTGAKSEEQSRLAARKYARIVQKLGFDAKFLDFKIQNMVGSCDVKFPIRLEGLVLTHSQFSSYEPELFPGLIYRMVKPRIVLLIFVSGKVVLTGAKVRGEIYEAFDNIYPILKSFKKQ
ncbi:hypothetical protein CHUAL_003324 [Chamberlinius hualienensis]